MIKTKLGLHTRLVVRVRFACVPVFMLPRCASRIHQPAPVGQPAPGRVPWVGTPSGEHLFPPGSAKVRRRMLIGCCWAREAVLGEGCQPGPPGHSSVQPLSSASCVQGHWSRLLNVVGSGFIIFGHLSAAPSGVWLGLGERDIPGLADQGGVWGAGTLGHPVLAPVPLRLGRWPFPLVGGKPILAFSWGCRWTLVLQGHPPGPQALGRGCTLLPPASLPSTMPDGGWGVPSPAFGLGPLR